MLERNRANQDWEIFVMTQQGTVRRKDRTIGVVYLLYFVSAIASLLLLKGVAVPGNPAATAQNILLHEPVFRASFSFNLIATAFYVALTALLYGLFEPVNRVISMLAAFFSLMGCAVQTFGSIFQLAPLVIFRGDASIATSNLNYLQTLSLIFLKFQAQAFNVGLVFFAFYCLLIGYLIFRSTLLPRFLGALMLAAGLGWLTFLVPSLAAQFSRYTQTLGFLAELSLMLWLLIKGVDAHVREPSLRP
jgi:hypothetical protein